MPFLKIITKNKLGKCKHISSMHGFPLLASFITNPRVRAGTAGLNLLHSSTHTTKKDGLTVSTRERICGHEFCCKKSTGAFKACTLKCSSAVFFITKVMMMRLWANKVWPKKQTKQSKRTHVGGRGIKTTLFIYLLQNKPLFHAISLKQCHITENIQTATRHRQTILTPGVKIRVPSGKVVKLPSDTAAAFSRPGVHSWSRKTGLHKPLGSPEERKGQEAGSQRGQTNPAWKTINPKLPVCLV